MRTIPYNNYITQYDSPLRWRVHSETRPHLSYVVDLYHWECQCEDWGCRHRPKWKETRDRQHRCKHMDAALGAFWKQVCFPRLAMVPVLRKFSNKWVTLNKWGLTLAFLDELIDATKDENV